MPLDRHTQTSFLPFDAEMKMRATAMCEAQGPGKRSDSSHGQMRFPFPIFAQDPNRALRLSLLCSFRKNSQSELQLQLIIKMVTIL